MREKRRGKESMHIYIYIYIDVCVCVMCIDKSFKKVYDSRCGAG